jgi:hypothetical protein
MQDRNTSPFWHVRIPATLLSQKTGTQEHVYNLRLLPYSPAAIDQRLHGENGGSD